MVDGWASAVEWPDDGLVVDVGGGSGGLLAAVLERRPRLRGCIVERAHVADAARRTFAARDLAGRAAVAELDFHVEVPPAADVYVLARVLHDWDDQRAQQILDVIARASCPRTRLRVIEGTGADDGGFADLSMLLLFGGGRERTVDELVALLERAGWRPIEVTEGSTTRLLEAELHR
jgi:hypothetical protein